MILGSGIRPACRTQIGRVRARFPDLLFLDFPEAMYMRLKLQRCTTPEGSLPDAASTQANSGRRETGLRSLWWLILMAVAGCTMPLAAQNKDSFSPMPLDAGFGHMDVSAPAIPPEQIIKQFAAKESEFQDALNHYTYRRYARVQTLDDDNKVDGEWYEVDDVIFDSTGRRTEKVVFAPGSTLQRVMMSPSDLQDIQRGYPFVLTAEEIGQYDVKYVGR